MITRVHDITPDPSSGDYHIWLDGSSAEHIVKASAGNRQGLLDALDAARVSGTVLEVTAHPLTHQIKDATAALAEISEQNPPPEPITSFIAPPVEIPLVPLQLATELFDLVEKKRCTLPDPQRRSIPFQYPDSGCWARAHEMWRVIFSAKNINVAKLWLFGSMTVPTPNHPDGRVTWSWHVAPVVRVEGTPGDQEHVIDPSVCTSLVSRATFIEAIGGQHAEPRVTGPLVYRHAWPGWGYRELYEGQGLADLCRFQCELRARANGQLKPPPY